MRGASLVTFATHAAVPRGTLAGHAVAVIDVLRWSTVVVTALSNGAEWLEAWATPAEAARRARSPRFDHVILGGERDNLALPGFDVGNSPAEYSSARVRARGVVTTTTNGTRGLLAAEGADEVVVACFLNLPSVVARLRAQAAQGRAIALIACGQAGAVADEDLACAGAIAEALADGAKPADPVTREAVATWAARGRDPRRAVEEATHAVALRAGGFAEDVNLAAACGVTRCIPRLAAPHRLTASYGSPPAPSST